MKRHSKNKSELYLAMRAAIFYMREHAAAHPTMADIARVAGMSPSRFEHAFRQWAGIAPKRFLAHLATLRAKHSLKNSKNIMKAAYVTGLSGAGRLYDLLVTHEAVTPGEYKHGGITIRYGIHPSPFGWCTLGITKRGICHLSFSDKNNIKKATALIAEEWPEAMIIYDVKATAQIAKKIFSPKNKKNKRPIHLLMKGTNFQIKVWEALLKIPEGKVATYAQVARAAGSPKAVRAAGSTCGKNKIPFLIPCHRVLASDGGIGGYSGGIKRKEAMLDWEEVRTIGE